MINVNMRIANIYKITFLFKAHDRTLKRNFNLNGWMSTNISLWDQRIWNNHKKPHIILMNKNPVDFGFRQVPQKRPQKRQPLHSSLWCKKNITVFPSKMLFFNYYWDNKPVLTKKANPQRGASTENSEKRKKIPLVFDLVFTGFFSVNLH